MPRKKTTPAKKKKPETKPQRKGNLVKDRVTGNWSRVPKSG